MSQRPTDEQWRMATGYATPDEANAALLKQAEQIKALADALMLARELGMSTQKAWDATTAALRLAGRL